MRLYGWDEKFWDAKLEDDIQGEVATVATLEEYTLLLNSLCAGNVADRKQWIHLIKTNEIKRYYT